MEKFVGLVGAEYWGKNILRNLYDLKVLHTVCESNPQVLNERKSQYPRVNYTSTFDDSLGNPSNKHRK